MHCDMLKIQDGVAIVEKLNSIIGIVHSSISVLHSFIPYTKFYNNRDGFGWGAHLLALASRDVPDTVFPDTG